MTETPFGPIADDEPPFDQAELYVDDQEERWAFEPAAIEPAPICLACGQPVEAGLIFVGSLRCGECRASRAPINRDLLAA